MLFGMDPQVAHPIIIIFVAQYIRLQDIKTSGGATFTAINSTDLGNNTGWAITPPSISTADLYWVVDSSGSSTGAWSDGARE